MLTIHLKGRHPRTESVTSQLTLTELFRTLRVIGEVPFVEPSPGLLLNLTQFERIEFDGEDEPDPTQLTVEDVAAPEDEQEAAMNIVPTPAEQAHGIATCAHGFILTTCSQCAKVIEEAIRSQPEW